MLLWTFLGTPLGSWVTSFCLVELLELPNICNESTSIHEVAAFKGEKYIPCKVIHAVIDEMWPCKTSWRPKDEYQILAWMANNGNSYPVLVGVKFVYRFASIWYYLIMLMICIVPWPSNLLCLGFCWTTFPSPLWNLREGAHNWVLALRV